MSKTTSLSQEEKQSVVAYLEKGYKIRQKIKLLEEKIRFYEERANSLSGTDYEKDRVQTSPGNTAPFVKWINLSIDTKREVDSLNVELTKANAEIMNTIDRIENLNEQKLLAMRFIDDDTFEFIAEELEHNISYIFKIYRKALVSVWNIINAAA